MEAGNEAVDFEYRISPACWDLLWPAAEAAALLPLLRPPSRSTLRRSRWRSELLSRFVARVVTSNTNQSVNWQVNSVAGGNTTVGTIDTNGNYTAPSTVPVPNTVTVTAIAQADATATASATVTIDSGIRVAVAPASVIIGTGEVLTFTPTVTGASAANQGVTWIVCQAGSISTVTSATAPCPADTTGTLGTVSSVGVYHAPPIIPTSNPVTIEAVSVKDKNQFGSGND